MFKSAIRHASAAPNWKSTLVDLMSFGRLVDSVQNLNFMWFRGVWLAIQDCKNAWIF